MDEYFKLTNEGANTGMLGCPVSTACAVLICFVYKSPIFTQFVWPIFWSIWSCRRAFASAALGVPARRAAEAAGRRAATGSASLRSREDARLALRATLRIANACESDISRKELNILREPRREFRTRVRNSAYRFGRGEALLPFLAAVSPFRLSLLAC